MCLEGINISWSANPSYNYAIFFQSNQKGRFPAEFTVSLSEMEFTDNLGLSGHDEVQERIYTKNKTTRNPVPEAIKYSSVRF